MAPVYSRLDELVSFVQQGMCTRRRHPELPIWIFNYSAKAQFEYNAENWPEALRDARGLVLDEQGRIVARSLRKFFNLSQLTALPAGLPEFYEKADGSLVLVFNYEGRRVVSTRGSFESPQAVWATQAFARVLPDFVPGSEVTYCLEAIYPGNRIVLDYGGREELVLLAAIDNRTGADADPALEPLKRHFRCAAFYGMLDPAAMPGNTGEGFVLRWSDGTRAKVKHDEYVRLHRMIYGTSTKTVWASLRAGASPESETEGLPEDLRRWVTDRAGRLRAQFQTLKDEAAATFDQARQAGLITAPRVQFAEWAKRQRYPHLLFRLLDNKAIDDEIWKLVEPAYQHPVWAEELE